VEAVLGILLGLPDQRVVNLLVELAEDSYLSVILEQVNVSSFGARRRLPIVAGQTDTARRAKEPPNPFIHGPTNDWQDSIIYKMGLRNGEEENVEPFGMRPSLMSTLSIPAQPVSGTACTLSEGFVLLLAV